jgi:hypothetical protein
MGEEKEKIRAGGTGELAGRASDIGNFFMGNNLLPIWAGGVVGWGGGSKS